MAGWADPATNEIAIAARRSVCGKRGIRGGQRSRKRYDRLIAKSLYLARKHDSVRYPGLAPLRRVTITITTITHAVYPSCQTRPTAPLFRCRHRHPRLRRQPRHLLPTPHARTTHLADLWVVLGAPDAHTGDAGRRPPRRRYGRPPPPPAPHRVGSHRRRVGPADVSEGRRTAAAAGSCRGNVVVRPPRGGDLRAQRRDADAAPTLCRPRLRVRSCGTVWRYPRLPRPPPPPHPPPPPGAPRTCIAAGHRRRRRRPLHRNRRRGCGGGGTPPAALPGAAAAAPAAAGGPPRAAARGRDGWQAHPPPPPPPPPLAATVQHRPPRRRTGRTRHAATADARLPAARRV